MNDRPSEEGVDVLESSGARVAARRSIWGRIALIFGIAVLALLAIGILVVWIQRRPIAGRPSWEEAVGLHRPVHRATSPAAR